MRAALIALFFCLCACSGPGPGCADCCPPGPTTTPVTLSCRLSRPDGGAASGVRASCSGIDAGSTADSSGDISISANRLTCGIATGAIDCGSVRFTDNGAEIFVDGKNDAGPASAFSLTATCCAKTVF